MCLTGTCIRMCRPSNINVPSTKDCALLATAFQCTVHQILTMPSTKNCLAGTCLIMYLPSDIYTAAIETLCFSRKTVPYCHLHYNISSIRHYCAINERMCLTGNCISVCCPSNINCASKERLCLTGACTAMCCLDINCAVNERMCLH